MAVAATGREEGRRSGRGEGRKERKEGRRGNRKRKEKGAFSADGKRGNQGRRGDSRVSKYRRGLFSGARVGRGGVLPSAFSFPPFPRQPLFIQLFFLPSFERCFVVFLLRLYSPSATGFSLSNAHPFTPDRMPSIQVSARSEVGASDPEVPRS